MPTFKQLIFKHQRKEDGTYNVKIRVTQNRESKYIATDLYIKDRQIDDGYEIKDRSVLKKTDAEIDAYWEIIKSIPDVSGLNVEQLLSTLAYEKARRQKVEIDFIAFSKKHIDGLSAKGEGKYAASFKTTVNSLCDFFSKEKVLITEINTKNLVAYEKYLKSERTISRRGRDGREVVTKREGMGNGVQTYMTNIRTLFNEARFVFNDEDEGVTNITHYPFQKYKLEKKKAPEKRNIKPGVVKQLLAFKEEKPTRATLGRDVFLISFYLVGTNLIDLYLAEKMKNGRIIYNRSKTEDRRTDSAHISIKIEWELTSLIEKYRDKSGKRVFTFYKMYATSENFIKAVNTGLSKVAQKLKLDHKLTSYYARHSWATIARNVCGVPKEDIAMALNHSDPKYKITDAYLETDWGIIDRANEKVFSLFRKVVTEDELEAELDRFLEENPDIVLDSYEANLQ